jgi:hypothetical protein
MRFPKFPKQRPEVAVEVAVEETDQELYRTKNRYIVRRIDQRLLLTSAIVLTICYVDRSLLPYANIAGMGKELHLQVGNRYVSILKHL